ncbi:MAG: hypothetical protein ACXAD7_21385, partial [Candidatus Kariarchaeaceae archaeon]
MRIRLWHILILAGVILLGLGWGRALFQGVSILGLKDSKLEFSPDKMILDNNGDIIIYGRTGLIPGRFYVDPVEGIGLRKMTDKGDILWTRHYGGIKHVDEIYIDNKNNIIIRAEIWVDPGDETQLLIIRSDGELLFTYSGVEKVTIDHEDSIWLVEYNDESSKSMLVKLEEVSANYYERIPVMDLTVSGYFYLDTTYCTGCGLYFDDSNNLIGIGSIGNETSGGNDLFLFKVDEEENVIFQTYLGSEHHDWLESVAFDQSGNTILLTTQCEVTGYFPCAAETEKRSVVSLNNIGQINWQYDLLTDLEQGGYIPNYSELTYQHSIPYDITPRVMTNENDIILVNRLDLVNVYNDTDSTLTSLLKLSSDGIILWNHTFASTSDNTNTQLLSDGQGNYYILRENIGWLYQDTIPAQPPRDQVLKIDNDGKILWVYNQTKHTGGKMLLDNQQNIILVQERSTNPNDPDAD